MDDATPDPATGADDALAERARQLRERDRDGQVLDHPDYVRHSRRSFLTGAVGIAAGTLGFRWVQTQDQLDGIPAILRRGHDLNDSLWSALPTPTTQARQFSTDRIQDLPVNGRQGMEDDIDMAAWSMEVVGRDGQVLDRVVAGDLADLEAASMVVQHKCIEGWSRVVAWEGVRFADFARRYGDAAVADYVGLVTPDQQYYVGLPQDAMRHPQTLLAHTLNGAPLTADHGGPLRLVSPNHYGIKSLKRIGRIEFTDTRPPDYWAERGYDWHSEF